MTDAPRAAVVLELADIVKRFGTVLALNGASLSVRGGTVHALLGENGAGKTTLMRVAFGMVRPEGGRIALHGKPMTWASPADAILAGLGMVHQHFTLVPAMTVADNVELGAGGISSTWRLDRRLAEERVRQLSRTSGLIVEPSARVSEISVAAQQRVEILKALGRNARILILDEPTAVLAPQESAEILRWLREYTAGGGTAILITHKLREALTVADDVTVLRRGRVTLTVRAGDANTESITRAMIGDDSEMEANVDVRAVSHDRPAAGAVPVVILDGVVASDEERREIIRASFAVHAGEVVGIAGVEGAGHHTLLRVLAGRIQPTAGQITRPATIGFVPEDRHRDGLILEFSIAENVALRGAGSRHGRMPWSVIHRRTAMLMNEFDVRASDETTTVGTLSGGNQQRLILARELDGRPGLLVAENPTRGLDVRSTAQVHERLQTAQDAGTAIVLYSSDLDEVLTLSTRVLAVHAGTVREVALDREAVGRVMLGLP